MKDLNDLIEVCNYTTIKKIYLVFSKKTDRFIEQEQDAFGDEY